MIRLFGIFCKYVSRLFGVRGILAVIRQVVPSKDFSDVSTT